MSKLLLKINQRSKLTHNMVMEIKNEWLIGVSIGPSPPLQIIENDLPEMPFSDCSELLIFEERLASKNGLSAKKSFVKIKFYQNVFSALVKLSPRIVAIFGAAKNLICFTIF